LECAAAGRRNSGSPEGAAGSLKRITAFAGIGTQNTPVISRRPPLMMTWRYHLISEQNKLGR
jgi:hypothetical protein